MVCVSARRTFSLRLVLMFIVSVCFLNVRSGSSITPRSVGLGLTWMGVLYSKTHGCAAISLSKEFIRVKDDLLGEIFSLFEVSQVSSWLMYS